MTTTTISQSDVVSAVTVFVNENSRPCPSKYLTEKFGADVVEVLARVLGVPKRDVRIVSGETARQKVVDVSEQIGSPLALSHTSVATMMSAPLPCPLSITFTTRVRPMSVPSTGSGR